MKQIAFITLFALIALSNSVFARSGTLSTPANSYYGPVVCYNPRTLCQYACNASENSVCSVINQSCENPNSPVVVGIFPSTKGSHYLMLTFLGFADMDCRIR